MWCFGIKIESISITYTFSHKDSPYQLVYIFLLPIYDEVCLPQKIEGKSLETNKHKGCQHKFT